MRIKIGLLQSKRRRGQTLADYALITVLLTAISIPIWMALGSSVGQRLSFFNNIPETDDLPQTPLVEVIGVGMQPPPMPSAMANQATLTITLSNGQTVSVANPLSTASQIIETAGANGATAAIGQTIQQLAKQLADANEISPSQLGMLTDLANQIHEVALLQGALEEAYKNVPDSMTMGEFKKKTVVVNGVEYTMEEAGGSLEVFGDDAKRLVSMTKFSDLDSLEQLANIYANNEQLDYYQNTSARKMLDKYMAAKQAGSLNNPEINQIVTALTNSVFNLSDSFMDAGFNSITYYTYPPDTSMGAAKQDYMQPPDQMVKTLQTSVTNHKSAKGVCESGNGTDSGTNCSP